MSGETARRELAAVVKLQVFEEKDSIVELFDEMCEFQWYCVFGGGVDVVIDGEIAFHIEPGVGFGQQPFIFNGVPRMDVILLTSEEFTELLNVSTNVYDRISKIVESSTSRVEDENGQTVLVLENQLRGDGTNRRNLTVYIARGTIEKIIERLVTEEAHLQDEFFLQDFFLSFRTFMSAIAVLEHFIQILEQPSSRAPPMVVKGAASVGLPISQTSTEVIVECLVYWLTNHPYDFTNKPTEQNMVMKIIQILTKYGFTNLAAMVRSAFFPLLPANEELSQKRSASVSALSTESAESAMTQHKRKLSGGTVGSSSGAVNTASTSANTTPTASASNISRQSFSVRSESKSSKMTSRMKNLFRSEEKTGLVSGLAALMAVATPAASGAAIEPALGSDSNGVNDDNSSTGSNSGNSGNSINSNNNNSSNSSGYFSSHNSPNSSVVSTPTGFKMKRNQSINSDEEFEVIRVYRSDLSYRYVPVYASTTVYEVVDEVLDLFGIQLKPGSGIERSDYVLVYVSCEGKTSMVRNTQTDLARYLSINSRYYLRCNANILEKFPRPDPFTIENESPILSMDLIELAKQLTLEDNSLFRSIKPLEYIEYLFKLSGAGDPTYAALNKFIERFNVINFWVVTEILSTKDLKKRVQVVKCFIILAHCLKSWNNYNSLYAVISGLAHSTVGRLRLTWKNINKRTMMSFKELENLMNPSRNMGIYRNLIGNLPPNTPVVPFFPLLIKDLVFIHEGNPSKVDGLINYDKRRLLCKTLRVISKLASVGYKDCNYNFEANLNFDGTNPDPSFNTTTSSVGPIGSAAVVVGGASAAMRKLFEKTRMKFFIKEYLKDFESKVETDLVKLNQKAQEIEQISQ